MVPLLGYTSHCILSYSHLIPIPCPHLASPPASKYKYVAQDFGKNSCSQGTLVDTEAECKQAALELKGSSALRSVKSWDYVSKGCLTGSSDSYFYFNTHSTGNGHSMYSPVCKVKGRYIPHPPHEDAKQDTYHHTSAHLTSPHPTSPHLTSCRSSGVLFQG